MKSAPVFITLAVLLCSGAFRVSDNSLMEWLEWKTYDLRVRRAAGQSLPAVTNLGFVAIDDSSIVTVQSGELGYRYGLYWPRQVYGRLVQELAQEGAATVAFDVVFGELRSDHPLVQMADGSYMESDEFFAEQLRQASNVILAVTRDLVPPPLFLTNALKIGDISTDQDADGVLRRVKAFRIYRHWHTCFREVEADPGYGVDLRKARVEPRRIILPRSNGEEIVIPTDDEGNFELADFKAEDALVGMPRKAPAYRDVRIWHMGIVLAARELGLNLDEAVLDLPQRRIVLTGPATDRVIPVDSEGRFYIDWCMPPNDPRLHQEPIQTLLWRNRVRLEGGGDTLDNPWRGKLAIVGSSASGNDLTDRGATPLQADTLLVSKHWNVANSVILGRFVRRGGSWQEVLIITGLALLAAVLTAAARPLRALVLVSVLGAGYVILTLVLYSRTRIWLPVAIPLLAALLTYLGLTTWRVVFEQSERRRVRAVFSKVVSPNVVNELLQVEKLALGGARREITVLFADVRGFTALTDTGQQQVENFVRQNKLSGLQAEECFDRQARETLETVNLYLALVADMVKRHDGTLDKYIGDCVMAFWGAPAATPNHALLCVRAAIDAQRAIARLNEERAAHNQRVAAERGGMGVSGTPESSLPLLSLGTGINTGLATVGLMGSDAHILSYTAFGREVNVASRLEGVSGRGRVIISETTYRHLQRDDPSLAARCVALAPVTVKGIREAVIIYEVPWQET